jgi:hypothetical protein
MQIFSCIIWAGARKFIGFFHCKVFYARISIEMVLDKESFTLIVDPLKSVGAMTIHVAVTIGGTSIRKQNSYLMNSLWT